MFFYTGKDPEAGEEIKKEFEELNDATNYADDMSTEYPVYEIYDNKTDEIVDSSEPDEDANSVAMGNMFPEGEESEEGFDWTGEDE
jgi:hypothetical protein